MAKHSSNVFTVLLLAAFLALVGVTVALWHHLNKGYSLTPKQILGLEPLPDPVKDPMKKSGAAPAPAGASLPADRGSASA